MARVQRVGWTAADLGDQSGRVAVITGANTGIGFETAAELGRVGAHVVLACRNATKAADAVARIRQRHPHASVEVVACDLSSQRSTRAAAATIGAAHPRIDLLIANAGVMAMPYERTEDGWELQFATNHLGHVTFVGALLDRLLDVPGSRVVTLTSNFHKFGKIHFHDLNAERRYRRWRAYCQSKLANLLFSNELSRRLVAAGAPTMAVAAHPGYAGTDIQARAAEASGRRVSAKLYDWGERLASHPPDVGAVPTLYAATVPDVVAGTMIAPKGVFQMHGPPHAAEPSRRGRDAADARRLWDVSLELTGTAYPV